MNRKIIKQANVVNEGIITVADVLIDGQRIEKISNHISYNNAEIIEADGLYLLPGIIDDQVHFRDPGLTHKGDIYSESRAAVAGGITSYSGNTPATYSTTSVNTNYLTDTNSFGTAIASTNDMTPYNLYLEFVPIKV